MRPSHALLAHGVVEQILIVRFSFAGTSMVSDRAFVIAASRELDRVLRENEGIEVSATLIQPLHRGSGRDCVDVTERLRRASKLEQRERPLRVA